MKYGAHNSWEIEGLDEPMINPELIPKGHVQCFDDATQTWRVRREGNKTYLEQFPVIHFTDHPDMLP